MKKIKYKIHNDECIGLISKGTIIDCYLVYEDVDSDGGLIYFPKNIRYTEDGKDFIDRGCGCLSFAVKSTKGDFYVRKEDDYINLRDKDANSFESQVKNSGINKTVDANDERTKLVQIIDTLTIENESMRDQLRFVKNNISQLHKELGSHE